MKRKKDEKLKWRWEIKLGKRKKKLIKEKMRRMARKNKVKGKERKK